MKKLLFFCCLISLPTLSVVGQSNDGLHLGFKVGVNSTSIADASNKIFTDSDSFLIDLKEAKIGFHGGLLFRLELGGLYLKPEFIFSTTGKNYRWKDLSLDGLDEAFEDKFYNFEIPLSLGVRIWKFRLEGGVTSRFVLQSYSDITDVKEHYSTFSDGGFSWSAGLGIDISKLTIDFRYTAPFNGRAEGIIVDGVRYNFDQRHPEVGLSLGIEF